MSKLGDLFVRWFLNARRLFEVVLGLTFLVLAAICAGVTFLRWRDYSRAPSSVGLFTFRMLAGFTVILVIFGLYSFIKARSIK